MSVKVGEVLDPEVNPFYQIIGNDGETSKIRLREGYSRSHVFTKGNTYKVSVKSPDVGEVRMLVPPTLEMLLPVLFFLPSLSFSSFFTPNVPFSREP